MGRSFSTFNYRGVCGAESKVRLYANSRVTHDLWVSLTVVDDGNWNLVRRNYDTAWDLIPQRGGRKVYTHATVKLDLEWRAFLSLCTGR